MKATPEQVAALMASGWVDSNLRACIPNRVAEGWPLECTFHRRVWGDRGCERAAGAADVVMALAEVLLAQAWDEGYTAGHSNAMRRMSDEPDAPTSPNPHRAAQVADVVVQAGEVTP